jgi:hypothetical protein
VGSAACRGTLRLRWQGDRVFVPSEIWGLPNGTFEPRFGGAHFICPQGCVRGTIRSSVSIVMSHLSPGGPPDEY